MGDLQREDRGDGALIVMPPGISPKGIIDPFPERLRALVRRHNHVSRPAGLQLGWQSISGWWFTTGTASSAAT